MINHLQKILSIIGVSAALILGAGYLFFREETLNLLTDARLFIKSVNLRSSQKTAFDLKLENQSLKAEIAGLKQSAAAKENPASNYIRAAVFSRYPWNDKYNLVVNAGTAHGVSAGMPVLAAPGVLIGRITAVKNKTSEMTAIFSPEWKSVVRLGTNGVEAVLEGGREPRISLIRKPGSVSERDSVVNASPFAPLGLRLGEIVNIKKSKNASFETALLDVGYDADEIKEVLIVADYDQYAPQ